MTNYTASLTKGNWTSYGEQIAEGMLAQMVLKSIAALMLKSMDRMLKNGYTITQ